MLLEEYMKWSKWSQLMENEYNQHEANEIKKMDFSATENDTELTTYKDKYVTEQQQLRDKEVTNLLQAYVNSYKEKVAKTQTYQNIILIPCIVIISIFSILLIAFSFMITRKSDLNVTDLAAFITACISFISLIIGLLTIITKYFFPENGEQYITQIVELIQKNDLENKRENAKNINNEHGEQKVGLPTFFYCKIFL